MSAITYGSASTAVTSTLAKATLGANGARISVPCRGMASAMVLVEGTGVMTLKFSGTADDDGVGPAGRRLWKAGVGSLGFSEFPISGATSSEYRVVLGGQYFSVDVTSYTSGSVNVTVLADTNSPIVFVSGPVHTAEEEALRAGRLFTVSTGFQSVSANNFLNAVFTNPATSGKNAFIEGRRFGSTANGTYAGIANPTVAATGTSVTPANSRTGSAASVMQFAYNMGTARLDTNPSNANPAGGHLAANDDETLLFKRLIRPGQSFGNFIGGAGGGLAAAATCSMTYYWYEEDVY